MKVDQGSQGCHCAWCYLTDLPRVLRVLRVIKIILWGDYQGYSVGWLSGIFCGVVIRVILWGDYQGSEGFKAYSVGCVFRVSGWLGPRK